MADFTQSLQSVLCHFCLQPHVKAATAKSIFQDVQQWSELQGQPKAVAVLVHTGTLRGVWLGRFDLPLGNSICFWRRQTLGGLEPYKI